MVSVFICRKKDEKRIKIFYFLPGFIGGLILHFHYLSIAPIVLCFIYLLFQKKWKKSFFFFLGVFLSVSPLMLFEVRNEFYLTKSFWLHLTQKPETPFKATFPPLIQRPILPLLAIGGIRLSELHYSNFPGLSSVFLTPISIIIIVFLIKKLIKDIKSKNNFFILHVFVLITAIAILTKTYIYLHYFFSIYPILIWYLTETIFETKIKGLSFPILLPFILGLVLFSNIVIVTKNRKLTKYMIPLTTQEKIGQIIAKDNPTGRYNITEALTGDARATSFRYFVLSQAKNRPLDEEHYNNLDTIYVVAKNEQQTIDLETWEFKATKNLELTKRWKVGGLYLFRFDRGK